MLKKTEINSLDSSGNYDDEKEDYHDGKRHGVGRFSGLGSKMEKIFRVAFRKDNISQSKEQLSDKMMDEPIKIEENKIVSNIGEIKETIECSQQDLDNSDYLIEDNFGSKLNLIDKRTKSSDNIHELTDKICDKSDTISKIRKKRKLVRSQNVQSKELESNSMNVIVDIHRENSNKESPRNISQTIADISLNDDNKKSLDTSQENSVDSIKKQRKRWSKDTSVIRLPKRNSLSSTSVSEKSNNWMEIDATPIPRPAPRHKKKLDNEIKKNIEFDNEAFQSENSDTDQILTIETEYGSVKSTKIEINSIKNEFNESHGKQNVDVKNEKLEKNLKISDIEEETPIRKLSLENSIINEEINSEIESEILTERKSTSVTSGRQKKILKRHSKKISITENSTSSMSDIQVNDEFHVREKMTKKKIKRQNQSTSSSHNSSASKTSQSDKKSSMKIKKKKKYKINKNKVSSIKYISISIHRADVLVPDYIIRYPMVIVHIVEETTGNYLKNLNKNNTDGIYLQPLITGIFDIKLNKTMMPCWDEELIFEYDYNAILNDEKNRALIFFEIVDLPSFADASSTYDQFGGHNCWYKIAWAFLKPLGTTGISHVDKIVRLQLYKPKRSVKKLGKHHCESYGWWKSGFREKYPSTLYVTVTSIDPPKLEPVFYGHLTLDEIPDEQMEPSKSITITGETGNLSRWSRLAAQSCKIPNEIFFKTDISENGCFYVMFSNNGKYLACANCDEYDYPIFIYKIHEEKIYIKFMGHKSFIYSLDWSNDDEILLSVSSDQTARLWDVKNKIIQEINMLPHPSYVYCGKFHPTNYHLIITGCYDHITRLWSKQKNTSNYELIQELNGHDGFVNSICFLKNGNFLTADSVGVIIQWSVKKRRGKLSIGEWQIAKKIKIREIQNVIINTIILHPLGTRLLVHSRDNGLRMLDLSTGVVVQRYMGLKNSRIQIAAEISPCGGLLLCGGEDATLNIWNLDTCKHIAIYSTNIPNAAVVCVNYHPYDHVLVYSIFGTASETIILRYNKQSTGDKVGLKLLKESEQKFHNIHDIESIKSSVKSNQRLARKNINNSIQLKNEMDEDDISDLIISNENREDVRTKLKLLNDSERQLKTKSANRLTNIIAKIDKILSNSGSTHRSTYDIEANKVNDTVNKEEILMHSPIKNDSNIVNRPYVPPLFSTFEYNSTSGSKSDTIEMTDMSDGKNLMTRKIKREKCKSAENYEAKSGQNYNKETPKIMSDSGMNIMSASRKKFRKSHNKSRDIDDYSQQLIVNNSMISNVPQSPVKDTRDDSSAESGGTYILEKKNDIEKIITSENSSVRSDVTFVIENEKPIPKPRRKHINQQNTIVQIE